MSGNKGRGCPPGRRGASHRGRSPNRRRTATQDRSHPERIRTSLRDPIRSVQIRADLGEAGRVPIEDWMEEHGGAYCGGGRSTRERSGPEGRGGTGGSVRARRVESAVSVGMQTGADGKSRRHVPSTRFGRSDGSVGTAWSVRDLRSRRFRRAAIVIARASRALSISFERNPGRLRGWPTGGSGSPSRRCGIRGPPSIAGCRPPSDRRSLAPDRRSAHTDPHDRTGSAKPAARHETRLRVRGGGCRGAAPGQGGRSRTGVHFGRRVLHHQAPGAHPLEPGDEPAHRDDGSPGHRPPREVTSSSVRRSRRCVVPAHRSGLDSAVILRPSGRIVARHRHPERPLP